MLSRARDAHFVATHLVTRPYLAPPRRAFTLSKNCGVLARARFQLALAATRCAYANSASLWCQAKVDFCLSFPNRGVARKRQELAMVVLTPCEVRLDDQSTGPGTSPNALSKRP